MERRRPAPAQLAVRSRRRVRRQHQSLSERLSRNQPARPGRVDPHHQRRWRRELQHGAPACRTPASTPSTCRPTKPTRTTTVCRVDLSSQVGKDLTLRAFYTLSRTIDPTTAGNGGGDLGNVSNPYAGWLYDIGPGGYDRTHNASVNFIYDLPIFRHTENRFLKTTLGGWEVSGIVTITSGLPINPQLTRRPERQRLAQCHQSSRSGWHPFPIRTPSASGSAPQSFAAPAVGACGDAGHNSLRGPGRDNWNLSLFKSFVLSETRGSRFETSRRDLQHLEPHRVQSGQQRPGFQQLRHKLLRPSTRVSSSLAEKSTSSPYREGGRTSVPFAEGGFVVLSRGRGGTKSRRVFF